MTYSALAIKIAHWSRSTYYGKVLLVGSAAWVENMLNEVEELLRLLSPLVQGLSRSPLQVTLIPYQNFIQGIPISNLEEDMDMLTGWMAHRLCIVVELESAQDPRYWQCIEGLQCGEGTVVWKV